MRGWTGRMFGRHVRPPFGLMLVVFRRSASKILICVLRDLIRCLEGSDSKEIVVERAVGNTKREALPG